MQSLNVLIVEDQESDAELMVAELRRSGFDPDWRRVDTEAEYVRLLNETDGPPADIVLSDYSLPGFTGLHALQLLRERDPDMPFILISGTVGEDVAVEVMKQGATDYLLKDRLTRLGLSVGQALEQRALRQAKREAEEQALRRLQRLEALRDIDVAISGSLDARVTLSVFVDKATTHLRADAADVLLLNPQAQVLEYITGRGFRTAALQHTRLRLGSGYAGRAALERRIVAVPDLRDAKADLEKSPLLPEEEFVSYFAAPLIAKGQVQGVMEVFTRRRFDPDGEWMDFLATLAGQAAIAIDSTASYNNLQRANAELILAYDTTLEGWSNALDLRDKETEGHTQRVTELTLRLARVMGMSEDALVHVRRGALLHDIGKMGIPDGILLKPGQLTEEEWVVMRRHPVYAYQLLLPITYLRPALSIPYSHHEKWDGTGYPRGLRGEEIPLEARVFAVADVWDALTSDRPYRTAWPKEKARAFIKEQSGTHFDPAVVDAFLRMSL